MGGDSCVRLVRLIHWQLRYHYSDSHHSHQIGAHSTHYQELSLTGSDEDSRTRCEGYQRKISRPSRCHEAPAKDDGTLSLCWCQHVWRLLANVAPNASAHRRVCVLPIMYRIARPVVPLGTRPLGS